MKRTSEAYYIADLYGELQLAPTERKRSWRAAVPGLVMALVAALAALFLSETYGAPSILIGLLLGFALNFASSDARLRPGLDVASQTLLRIGIVLLGLRVTFDQIAALGIVPFLALVGIMAGVIATGIVAARAFRLDSHFGLLAGGATAICGVSAALALWSVLGEKRIGEERLSITVLGITLASAVALATYPALAAMLGLSDIQAGFLVGASIHDVAQAIGGGFAVSEGAGEVATVVKLSRVALLVPVLLLVTLAVGASREGGAMKLSIKTAVPWFIAGFVVLVALGSAVDFPDAVRDQGASLAGFLLLLAVTAAAMKADLSGILAHGWRAFVPVVAATLAAFALALAVAVTL